MKQKKRSMFFRMVTASLLRRRSRMFIALLAIAIGAAILTGLLTIYYDVPRQLGAQFRNYGANMILQPTGETMTTEEMDEAVSVIDSNALVGAAGYRYQAMRIHEQPVTAAGVDMSEAQKTAPYWSVDGEWPTESGELMVGANVADDLNLRVGSSVEVDYYDEEDSDSTDTVEVVSEGDSTDTDEVTSDAKAAEDTESVVSDADTDSAIESIASDADADSAIESVASETDTDSSVESVASDAETESAVDAVTSDAETAEDAADTDADEDSEVDLGSYIDFTVVGILSTGGSEEDYVYMSTEDMETLTGISGIVDIVELSVSGSSDQLTAYMNEINEEYPAVNASLVKRITASETTVLSKLQYLILLVTIVSLALTMICVATTMTATVTERRIEIGLKKAIGATDAEIIQEFMGETLFLGGVGGLLGGFLGFAFAQLISQSVFASSISFRPTILPIAIIASLVVTSIACLIPIRRATSIEPALVLKGE